jgi:hypothetical protein
MEQATAMVLAVGPPGCLPNPLAFSDRACVPISICTNGFCPFRGVANLQAPSPGPLNALRYAKNTWSAGRVSMIRSCLRVG